MDWACMVVGWVGVLVGVVLTRLWEAFGLDQKLHR